MGALASLIKAPLALIRELPHNRLEFCDGGHRMRREKTTFAVMALALGLAVLPAARSALASSAAASGNRGLSASGAVDFTVNVPKVMQLRMLAHPSTLQVTADDIGRGSITVSGPMLDLLVNDRLGYVIRADLMNAAFRAVRLVGLSSDEVATQTGALVRMATMVGKSKPAPMPVAYELQLAPDAQPGSYPWPVALSLQEP